MTQPQKTTRREEYQIGEDLFVKECRPDRSVVFYKNERELDLETWNKELNKFQSMSVKSEHGNPFVRWLEKHRRLDFLRFVGARSGDTVAAVGCETDYLSAELVKKGCHVICIASKLLEKARQRIEPRPANYLVSDIRNLQLPDKSVDITLQAK